MCANLCNECGQLIAKGRRYCDVCAKKRIIASRKKSDAKRYGIGKEKCLETQIRWYYKTKRGLSGKFLEMAVQMWRLHRNGDSKVRTKLLSQRPPTEFERIGAEPKVFANQPPEKFAKLIGQYLNTF